MGFGIICCVFLLMTKKKKQKTNRFHNMLPNRLLNTNVCSNWLHLLILFFFFFPSAYSFRLLLRSCCWGSQWDWSVILWQITTMLVCFLAISVSALYPVQGWHPRLVCGIPLHSLLSAAGMAASNRGWCGQCWVVLPEPFVYNFGGFAWLMMYRNPVFMFLCRVLQV